MIQTTRVLNAEAGLIRGIGKIADLPDILHDPGNVFPPFIQVISCSALRVPTSDILLFS
jgi:hypothetical protein